MSISWYSMNLRQFLSVLWVLVASSFCPSNLMFSQSYNVFWQCHSLLVCYFITKFTRKHPLESYPDRIHHKKGLVSITFYSGLKADVKFTFDFSLLATLFNRLRIITVQETYVFTAEGIHLVEIIVNLFYSAERK